MATRLRLCRLPAHQYAAPDAAGQPLSLGYPAIRPLLARLLPDITVALFAEPVPSADGQSIDWCSSLPGQPVPLASLGAAEQAPVLTRLRERLEQTQAIATRLGQTGDGANADRLTRMAVEPAPEQIYVQNGEPVMVGWGCHGALPAAASMPAAAAMAVPAAAATAVAAPAPAPAAAAEEEQPAARRPWWRWLLWLLPLLLLLAGILYFLRFCQEPPPPEPKKEEPPKAEEPKTPEDLSDLKEKIRKAEEELQKRLDACPVPEVLPKELPKEPDPFPPVKTEPPKEEPKPEPVKPEPPKPEKKPEPPKPVPPKPEPPKAEAPKPTPPKEEPKQAQACPPKAKPWEKPEVAILLDASGSMGLPATLNNADARALAQKAAMGDPAARARLTGGKGSRLEVAKDSVADLTRTIPPEVDLGLLVFGRCEGTDNYKFFSNAERPQMVAQVQKIQTQEGTPLARGLERAGNMIDGVSVPGTIVVVSDGEDSCGGDPCAVARALKQKKPNLKINVISVDGSGTGKCMAEISGGRVLRPREGENWDDLMLRATDQAPRPPGCP